MKTDTLARMAGGMPYVFDDLLRPWNDWFDGRELWNRAASLPPVNIVEQEDKYLVSLAAPGMKRDDVVGMPLSLINPQSDGNFALHNNIFEMFVLKGFPN